MNQTQEEFRLCPLCGHRFPKGTRDCRPGCPFRKNCGLICCPHCHYQFLEDSKLVGLWRKRRSGRERKENV